MKVLVTGVDGQLGSEIKKISSNYKYNWVFTNRKLFDLYNLENINTYLEKCSPELIINCAAYTSVDDAEENYEIADIINHKSIKLIAKWCYSNKCKLIHISTNYVYSGNSRVPYKEESKTDPINRYGKSKLDGDFACQKLNPSTIIIRTSWLYSAYGDNFLKKIISLLINNNKFKVIDDHYSSPTNAADLANVILKIINFKKWIPGIYNYTNFGVLSYYHFAKNIKSIFHSNTDIEPVSSREFYKKNIRPKYSVLDNSKIINTFNIKQVNYLDSLRLCVKNCTK